MFINISVNLYGSEYEEQEEIKIRIFLIHWSCLLPILDEQTIRILSPKHPRDFSTSHKEVQRELLWAGKLKALLLCQTLLLQ
jgi:hypothetical protein